MLLLVCRLLACIPLRIAHAIGRILGRLVYALPGRFRDRLRANAAQAGYRDPAFCWRAAGETGAMIAELPHVWFRHEETMAKVIMDEDALSSLVEPVRVQARGILFLSPHLGCFEAMARRVAIAAPLTVMFRPPRKSYLEPLMLEARNTSGLLAVPANPKGVKQLLRVLKAKGMVGVLPDQVPKEGNGVWAPFFGRLAYTVTLPGKLASHTGAAVIGMACERLPKGQGWRTHYARVPEPLPESPEQQAALFNQVMESLIRQFPEQYLWSYHRYKEPRHAPTPSALSRTLSNE